MTLKECPDCGCVYNDGHTQKFDEKGNIIVTMAFRKCPACSLLDIIDAMSEE